VDLGAKTIFLNVTQYEYKGMKSGRHQRNLITYSFAILTVGISKPFRVMSSVKSCNMGLKRS